MRLIFQEGEVLPNEARVQKIENRWGYCGTENASGRAGSGRKHPKGIPKEGV